jgi:hypothetical protein
MQIYTCSLSSDAEFMRSTVSGSVALATDGDTSSASGARTFTLHIPLTSRPAPPSVSAQMRSCTVWVYLRERVNRASLATTTWTALQR